MSYKPYYTNGWKSGMAGGTPITPGALNHMEAGIEAAAAHESSTSNPHSVTAAQVGAAASSHTHKYAGSSSAGGAANSVKTNLVVKLNSGSTEGTNLFTYNGGTAKTVNITPSSIGAAASSHGTHVSYGTSAKALGTSSAGSASTVSRSDHVHALPALTSCTGTLSVAKGGTGATSAANARKNLGLANFHAIETSSTEWKSNLNILKGCFSSITNVQSVVITHNNAGARVTCFGCKYDNYGYFIVVNINGAYLYKNYNGTWSETTITTW